MVWWPGLATIAHFSVTSSPSFMIELLFLPSRNSQTSGLSETKKTIQTPIQLGEIEFKVTEKWKFLESLSWQEFLTNYCFWPIWICSNEVVVFWNRHNARSSKCAKVEIQRQILWHKSSESSQDCFSFTNKNWGEQLLLLKFFVNSNFQTLNFPKVCPIFVDSAVSGLIFVSNTQIYILLTSSKKPNLRIPNPR